MTQRNAVPRQVAKEILWIYWIASELRGEKKFYMGLQNLVAAEILQQFPKETRIWVGREVQVRMGMYVIHATLIDVVPPLASVVDETTSFLAEYRERDREEGQDISAFISEVIRYPESRQGKIYQTLVGIDDIKRNIMQKLTLLLFPQYVERWLSQHYASEPPEALRSVLLDRYPLLILEGEVGSGKTALARSVGHILAEHTKVNIILYIVNAQVRGGGHVGELTQNIARAFAEAERCQEREQVPVLLLIDEADALAQSRGGKTTHHEDDAGVNTLIQHIDKLRGRTMAVLFATNLVTSLDSAILRRALGVYHFERPTYEQRVELFRRLLASIPLQDEDYIELGDATDPRQIPDYGDGWHRYTFSDLSQRIIPYAVETAIYEKMPLEKVHLIEACASILPTPETYDLEIQELECYSRLAQS